MIQFSSIAGHLQIKIAEQIGYFDQLPFVLSSKHGEDVLRLTKHKPVLEIDKLTIKDTDVSFSYNRVSYLNFGKKWSELSQLPVLPRFKVSKLDMRYDAMYNLEELSEKAVFVPSEVIFECSYGSADAFLKVLEMFYIKGFCSVVSRDFFSLSEFREIQSVSLIARDKPDYFFLLLRAPKIRLVHQKSSNDNLITANLFIQQWFEKKRNLEWFQVNCYVFNRTTKNIKEDILFSGVPFTFIWNSKDEFEGRPKKIKFRKGIYDFNFKEYERDWTFQGCVYSIDRGDKKLMIYNCGGVLVVQEYTKLDDVIEICFL